MKGTVKASHLFRSRHLWTQAPVANACNSSYTDRYKENHNLKPSLAKSSQDPVSKTQNRAGEMAQVVERLPSKAEFKLQYHQRKKKKVDSYI
jgi:hypothetical protein